MIAARDLSQSTVKVGG